MRTLDSQVLQDHSLSLGHIQSDLPTWGRYLDRIKPTAFGLGFPSLSTADISGWMIPSCGAALCILGCLAASLAFPHWMLVECPTTELWQTKMAPETLTNVNVFSGWYWLWLRTTGVDGPTPDSRFYHVRAFWLWASRSSLPTSNSSCIY